MFTKSAKSLERLAYNMNFNDNSYWQAYRALREWQQHPTTTEEHQRLRDVYIEEHKKRHATYQSNFDKANKRLEIISKLIGLGPLFEAAELFEERKEIRAVRNLIMGYRRDLR